MLFLDLSEIVGYSNALSLRDEELEKARDSLGEETGNMPTEKLGKPFGGFDNRDRAVSI
jgi:hypothetical protein